MWILWRTFPTTPQQSQRRQPSATVAASVGEGDVVAASLAGETPWLCIGCRRAPVLEGGRAPLLGRGRAPLLGRGCRFSRPLELHIGGGYWPL